MSVLNGPCRNCFPPPWAIHCSDPSCFARGADVAGVFGLSVIILLANDCVVAMIRGAGSEKGDRGKKILGSMACLAALVLIPAGYGVIRCHQFAVRDSGNDTINAGIVQAGISHYDRLAAESGTYATARMILDAHEELSLALLSRGDIDLLVWPETVYPLTFKAPESPDAAALDLDIEEFVMGTGVPLVFGAYDVEGDQRFNAAVFVEPASSGDDLMFHTYRKTRLFPFTERTPFLFDRPAVHSLLPWLGRWTPGPGPRTVDLSLIDGRSVKIAPLICYDALDPSHVIEAVRGGGEVIVTLSNDSWFAYGNVPQFILIISAFRSIETRRPQIRATNTGISAVITPTGDIVGRLDLNERGILAGSVRPETRMTPMLMFGDWFGPAALAAALLILGSLLIRNHAAKTKH
jgi:apolipoprotein N-acyltransferase